MVQTEACKIPILMYHSISSYARPAFKRLTVPPATFAKQMSYLEQCSYQPVTVTQLASAMARGGAGLRARPVILTFDDGFADFYTHALPVLNHYGFAATLYIVTAFVGSTSRWLRCEGETTRPMLTWSQLADINASGIECGAHSHHHLRLDTLPLCTARDEIVRCKRILEEQLAQEVTTFAYPFGCYNAALREMVQEAGYSSACAVKYTTNSMADDPFALARLMISAEMGVDDFATLLEDV